MKYIFYPKGDRTRFLSYGGLKNGYDYVWIGKNDECFGFIEIKRIKKLCQRILKDLENGRKG